jgi:cytochrome c6
MNRSIRPYLALLVMLFAASAAGFAETGEAVYKTKCQMCHGSTGLADSGAGRTMKVKPVTDPEVKKMTRAEMIKATEDGMGSMRAYKGKLSDEEIKGSVDYFRTFIK